jgi:hypothetical protein
MRHIVLFCLLSTGAQATIQNVSVLGSTATQALIHYTAPNNSPCNVEVSESPTFLPLVNDVDGTKFASASSDSRPGAIANGAERLFVVGKRAAEVGIDTLRYSRALQTATQHYFRITCPATGDQATGTFQTTSIPFGASYAEPEASDPNQPGSYAYPTLSTNDRTQTLVDPQTGLLIKRLNLPKEFTINPTGVGFPVTRSNAWNNLTNLQAADGQAAAVSSSTGSLFMGLNAGRPWMGYMRPDSSGYQGIEGGFGYYQVHVIAAVNPGGSAPANPDDGAILVCLTVDGTTCYAGSSQYQASLTTRLTDTSFGTTNTVDLWQTLPSTTLPRWTISASRNGNVLCDGSPNVTLSGGNVFGIHWGPGSNININGTDYSIASIVNTAQLTLAENCPSSLIVAGAFDQNSNTFRTVADTFQPGDVGRQIEILGAGGGSGPWISSIGQVIDARTIVTNDSPAVTGASTQFGFTYAYSGNNFGVLISKKTGSGDTIAIDYAYVNFELDFYAQFTDQGGLEYCSKNTVIGPNGRPGYNCTITSMGNLYWVDAASAETHFLGGTTTFNPNAGCTSQGQYHDLNDPDTNYCAGSGVVYSVKYYGNHSEPVALNPGGNFGIFQGMPNCDPTLGSAPYRSQQPCVVTKLLTPGTDVITLAGQFSSNPAYPPAMDTVNFRNLTFWAVDENGDLIFTTYRGNNDTVGWDFVFRPSATGNTEGGSSTGPLNNHGCVGGGHSGCVIAAMPSWARPGCRWCVIKGAIAPYPGWINGSTYGWTNSSPGSGPYYVPVVDGTPNGTLNYLDGSASLIDCPQNQFGATGRNCSTLTVGSEPLSPPHGGGETGLPGELGNAQLGDYFATQVGLPLGTTEQMMLIGKQPGAVAGTWIYTLWRKINAANGANYATTGPNPPLYTVCGANQVLALQPSGSGWYWNFLADPHGMNPTGQTIPPSPTAALGHAFFAHGNFGVDGTPNTDHRCAAGQYSCYATVLLNGRPFLESLDSPAATGIQTLVPTFGHGSRWDGTNLQSHPTGGGVSAPPDRFNFMFDARPYYGGYSSGSITGSGSNPATLIAGQLYKFPVSSMPSIDLPFRKIYPTAAFTGQLPLVDVSSPATGNVLGTGSADSYKYCVAAALNECRQGSAIGDVYVNAPYVRYPFCYNEPQNGNLSDEFDICISGSPSVRDALVQVDMSMVDNEGQAQRILTKYRRARVMSIFDTVYVLPNAQWMIFEGQFVGDGSLNKSYFIAKIPPPPAKDSYNRLDFIPISITLPPLNGATQAFVRFGYAENGSATSLYCTSRKESCVVGASAASTPVDPVNPFFLEQTEAATWNPANCASGCTITVPGIPQRALYYQFVYKNSAGIVYTSPVSATIVP